MSSSKFTITKHTSPCSYVRQFPHGVKHEEAVLQLAVKEYRPRNNNPPAEDSVTIIAAHANGFPKECYEPLWDDLLDAENGFKLGSIWVADVAHQGASYPLNETELGDDPNWLDHSRDLLLMINRFRDKMKPPFVGVAHSMGGAQIVNLALIHPRLFHSLVLIEPVIQDFPPPGPNAALFSSARREFWDSRDLAESQVRRNGFFKSMDPRTLNNYLKYALKDLPDGRVTLATPKAQEAFSYIRPTFQPLPEDNDRQEARQRERLLNPDFLPWSKYATAVWTRPEGIPVLNSLPNVRPRTLWLYGDFSHINYDEIREMHITRTGTGHGGNGGKQEGGVEERIIDDAGHLCCFENCSAVAANMSEWLSKETTRWRKEKEIWATIDTGKSKDDRRELSARWLAGVKEDANVQRAIVKDLPKL